MHTSNTQSKLHVSGSAVFAKVLNGLRIIGRVLAAKSPASSDFSASLCPLL